MQRKNTEMKFMRQYKSLTFLLLTGVILSKTIYAEEVKKSVQTHDVKAITTRITDTECQKIIPATYPISWNKDTRVIKEIHISKYLMLRDDHELTPNSETLTRNNNKVFIFKAVLKRPQEQKTQIIAGVSFFKLLDDKSVEGVFIIDGFCQAHFVRSA